MASDAPPHLDPPRGTTVAPPTVSWPDPANMHSGVIMPCPNCGVGGEKLQLLTVHFATPDHPMRHARVLRCAECQCLFYENQTPPDYTDGDMLGRGRVSFYLQQGAGVSLITRPLARVIAPPGSIYLEVGCGFGFGLDFAIRAKGWVGTGIDPGQIAGRGSELLGVPIEQRYLGTAEPRWNGICDVVMASETIEHVPSPRDFVAILRRALRPGGVLILTTPSGDALHPGQSPGLLVPLLSPGLHLVFQTCASLENLLRQAGFLHIVLETDGSSLIAFASDAVPRLESDQAVLRLAYRDYLRRRASSVPPGSDLFLAFAGRALQEAVNDAEMDEADEAGRMLRVACRDRFGFGLDTLTSLPGEAATCALERLAELMPLNLGGILYADSIRRIAAGVPRPALARRFDLAADAADAMRRALGELAMEDGMSEAIAWEARAEALLCDAASGAGNVVARLRRFPRAPGDDGRAGAERREALAERALVGAVNAGHIRLGRDIAAATGLAASDEGDAEAITVTRRDALFCLGVMDVQGDADADPRRGARRFAAVLLALGQTDAALAREAARGMYQALDQVWNTAEAETLLQHLRRFAAGPEIQDGTHVLAATLGRRLFVLWVNEGDYARARGIADFVAANLDESQLEPHWTVTTRDVMFCLGILELQTGGDLVRARDLLSRVRSAVLARGLTLEEPDLFWAALLGELQAIERLDGADVAAAHRQSVLRGEGNDAVHPGRPPPEPRC